METISKIILIQIHQSFSLIFFNIYAGFRCAWVANIVHYLWHHVNLHKISRASHTHIIVTYILPYKVQLQYKMIQSSFCLLSPKHQLAIVLFKELKKWADSSCLPINQPIPCGSYMHSVAWLISQYLEHVMVVGSGILIVI